MLLLLSFLLEFKSRTPHLDANAALKLVLNGVANCLSSQSISYCTTGYSVFHSILDFHHDGIKAYLEQLLHIVFTLCTHQMLKVTQVVSISGKRNMDTAQRCFALRPYPCLVVWKHCASMSLVLRLVQLPVMASSNMWPCHGLCHAMQHVARTFIWTI